MILIFLVVDDVLGSSCDPPDHPGGALTAAHPIHFSILYILWIGSRTTPHNSFRFSSLIITFGRFSGLISSYVGSLSFEV